MNTFAKVTIIILLVIFVPGPGYLDAAEPKGKYTNATCKLIEGGTSDLKPLMGKKVYLLGKCKEYMSPALLLADFPFKVIVKDRRFTDIIFDLAPKRKNILVYGYVARDPKYGVVIVAKNVKHGMTDLEFFKKLINKVKSTDHKGLMAVAGKALKRSKEYKDKELRKLAKDTYKSAFKVAEKAASGDAVKLAALAEKYYITLADSKKAIEIYLSAYKTDPTLEAATAGLTDLGCRMYKGKWLTRSKYMIAEGFVLFRFNWVKPEEKVFKLKVDKRRKNREKIIRTMTPDSLKRATEKKRLLKGMDPKEVSRSWRFPDSILKAAEGDDKYIMWLYENSSYAIFENKVLFTWKDRHEK